MIWFSYNTVSYSPIILHKLEQTPSCSCDNVIGGGLPAALEFTVWSACNNMSLIATSSEHDSSDIVMLYSCQSHDVVNYHSSKLISSQISVHPNC
jgi:hypothetical protein